MRKFVSMLLAVMITLSAAGCASRTVEQNAEPILERSSSESVYGGEQPKADEKIILNESASVPQLASSQQSSSNAENSSTESSSEIAKPSEKAQSPSAESSSVDTSEDENASAETSQDEPCTDQPSSELETEEETQEQPETTSPKIDTPVKTTETETKEVTEVLSAKPVYNEVRAIWFSYLTLEPMVKNKSEAQFIENLDQAFSNVKGMGFNTVFMHVRPFGDALYKSSYYPWSYLLSGTEGQNPGYDPLEIMCQLADSHGLRIEAWINPYRVRTSSSRPMASNNQAKKWLNAGNDAVLEWNGGIYYNPGNETARKLIVNGVKEIVKKYNVDGIHFDDYFYPTTDLSFDKATYSASGSSKSQADWRRENVNILVRQVYSAVKSIDASCVFGISPQGNTQNNFNVQFIDCAKWLANKGYVDYICPQIYFGFENSGHPFAQTVDTWNRMIRVSGIDLYVGLAAYKLGKTDDWAGAGKNEWLNTSNILAEMVKTARDSSHYGGSAVYSYESLFCTNSAQVKTEKQNLKTLF